MSESAAPYLDKAGQKISEGVKTVSESVFRKRY